MSAVTSNHGSVSSPALSPVGRGEREDNDQSSGQNKPLNRMNAGV